MLRIIIIDTLLIVHQTYTSCCTSLRTFLCAPNVSNAINARLQNMYGSNVAGFLPVLFNILLTVPIISALTYQDTADIDVMQGREQYQLIQKQTRLPKFGNCWKDALHSLEIGCKELSEDTQHHLAFLFMNCFLQKAGRDTVTCEDGLTSCAYKLDSASLQIYNDYFIHTNNMCSFLQLQVWNEQTSSTIDRLASSSNQVAEQLSESSQITQQMLKQQEDSLKNQAVLNEAIASSSDNVHRMFDDYKRTTKQQQLIMGEVFEKISSLQSMVLGEFAGFYSLLFHALSILISYLLTSTPRTSSARFWLFSLSIMNIGVERLIVYYHTSFGLDINSDSVLYADFWRARKFFWSASILVLLKSAFTYRDYNIINNNLLMEIKRQNNEIRKFIKADDDCSMVPYDESLDDTWTLDQTSPLVDSVFVPAGANQTYVVSSNYSIDQAEIEAIQREANELLHDTTQAYVQTSSSGYHLRERIRRPSWNPILDNETAEDFMRVVSRSHRIRTVS